MDSNKRFLNIPTEESYKGYNDMAEFIETVEDKHLFELLSVAINGKGAFRRFKDVLGRYPDERERWFAFEEQRAKERVLEWLEDEDIEVEE